MEANLAKRECGPCTACCTANPVPEMQKPPASPCAQCAVSGCQIYDTRPKTCQNYNCAWVSGMLPAWASPTVTGLIADLQSLTVPPIVGPRLTWVVKETRPNSAGSDAGTALINLLMQTGLTGAQGIQVAQAGNIPLVLVSHGAPPGQGRVIEGILADAGSDALVANKKPGIIH
jgi:hypothetical protein